MCHHKINHSAEVGETGKAPEGIMLIFGDIRISYLFDKYFPASAGFVPRLKALDPGGITQDPNHWHEVPCMQ